MKRRPWVIPSGFALLGISICGIVPGLVVFETSTERASRRFEGYVLPVNPETFRITGITEIASDTLGIESSSNYQGGACYENRVLLCENDFENILSFDLAGRGKPKLIKTGRKDYRFHCNNAFFGDWFYYPWDHFPVFYVSMEHPEIHATYGFRIYNENGNTIIVEAQCLVFVEEEGKPLYYPNSYLDLEAGILYYGGYTLNSFEKTVNGKENRLLYYAFKMPGKEVRRANLYAKEALRSFSLPAENATQGGFINGGVLYQTFSFDSKESKKDAPKMRIVDLKEERVVKDFQDLGAFGVNDEFENLLLTKSGRLLSHGNSLGRLYEIEYTSSFEN